MIELAGVLVVCAVLGALVDRAWLGDPARDGFERLGRAWMLGFGVAACLGMALDLVGLGVTATTFGVAGAVFALAVGAAARGKSWARVVAPDEPAVRSTGERVAIVVLALIAFASLAVVIRSGWVRPTFQFDAVTRWMFKAKALAVHGSLLGDVSYDPLFAFTHQRYPPLVSHVAALPAIFSGNFDDRITSAIFPWFAVAATLVVYGAVARRVGVLSGVFAAAWIATLPLVGYLAFPPPGAGAFSAMADIPLALFVTGAVLAASDALDGRRDRAHLEAGLLLGFALLTKNEGLPLAVGMGLGVLVLARGARLRRVAGIVGLGAGVYLALWGLVSLGFPALDEHYPDRLNVDAVQEGLDRIPLVAAAIGHELIDVRGWNVTWIAVLILLAVGWRRGATRGLSLVPIVVCVQIAAYSLAYVVTSWTSPAAELNTAGGDPLSYLLTLTLGRLMLHVAFVSIACAVIVAPLRWPSPHDPPGV